MGKFEQAGKVGLREKVSKKLIAIYPFQVKGSDEEIDKMVRDWYYKQSCQAEDQLLTAIVDTLTEQELKRGSGGK
ncbi:MAG: hypothetical protein H6Q72_2588 [Firmicutes bacterium]|nr:hypothetical protein [Bacillota bacterium]